MQLGAGREAATLAPPPRDRDVEDDAAVTLSPRSRAWLVLRRDASFWVGLALAALIVSASLAAPLIAPHDPVHQYRELMPLDGSALPPSEMFPLGTDVAGRDYLSRLLHAGRSTLLVGLGATFVATLIGLLVGALAAFPGSVRVQLPRGREVRVPLDTPLMRLTDLGLAFPVLLLAIAATAVLGRSLLLVLTVMAAVLWTATARLTYGRLVVVRSEDFVTAARALGCGDWYILRRHLLPHLLPLLLAYATLGIAATIMFEAALSYIGAGAPPQDPTWGRLLADTASYYRSDFRLPLLPGLAIIATVLAFNLMGDALRDATDPRSWSR